MKSGRPCQAEGHGVPWRAGLSRGKSRHPQEAQGLADVRVAAQAVKAAEEAERAWEADVPEKRREALEAAQQAADFAQQTYKHLRLVHN